MTFGGRLFRAAAVSMWRRRDRCTNGGASEDAPSGRHRPGTGGSPTDGRGARWFGRAWYRPDAAVVVRAQRHRASSVVTSLPHCAPRAHRRRVQAGAPARRHRLPSRVRSADSHDRSLPLALTASVVIRPATCAQPDRTVPGLPAVVPGNTHVVQRERRVAEARFSDQMDLRVIGVRPLPVAEALARGERVHRLAVAQHLDAPRLVAHRPRAINCAMRSRARS